MNFMGFLSLSVFWVFLGGGGLFVQFLAPVCGIWILVPWPGIKPTPTTLEPLNHWAAGGSPYEF